MKGFGNYLTEVFVGGGYRLTPMRRKVLKAAEKSGGLARERSKAILDYANTKPTKSNHNKLRYVKSELQHYGKQDRKNRRAKKTKSINVREGVEHGDRPKPKPEYFKRPFDISGKIVQLYPVFDIPVKTEKYKRTRFRIGDREGYSPYVDSPGQKAYDIKMSVWRWRVRIQTDEGWMLMGYIGSTKTKESLPRIRMGDRVELSDLILSEMTGGNLVTTSGWRSYGDTQYSEKQVDYRSRRFDRQLHGKVKRKAV
jgi:hypothetical protein